VTVLFAWDNSDFGLKGAFHFSIFSYFLPVSAGMSVLSLSSRSLSGSIKLTLALSFWITGTVYFEEAEGVFFCPC